MKIRLYQGGIILLLLFIFRKIANRIFFYIQYRSQPFMLGDWLINYRDGGFRRRGLSGEFFFLLQDWTGLSLQHLVIFVQLFFLFLFFYFCTKIILKKILEEPLYFLLFLLPTTLFFWVNDYGGAGRKEVLFLAIFSFFIYIRKENRRRYGYLFGGALAICTLFHELTLFYVPYFVFVLWLDHKTVSCKEVLSLCLLPLFSFLCIYFFGDIHFSNGNVMNILKERGVTDMSNSLIDYKDPAKLSWGTLLEFGTKGYIFPILFTVVALLIYEWVYHRNIIITPLYVFATILSMPLFLLAIDWGRWIFIHSIMSVLMLSLVTSAHTYIHTYIHTSAAAKWLFILVVIVGFLFKMFHVGNGFVGSYLWHKFKLLMSF